MDIEIETQPSPQQVPTKIWNKIFISLFISNVAMGMGQQMSNSIVAKYADSLGAPASQIGMLMSMFAITALIFKFISAPMMDTYNRKYILMGAIFIIALAFFGYSISKSVNSMIVFRLLQGTAMAFSGPVCLALTADALPPDQFGVGIGYFSLGQVVSQAVGPTIGLALVRLVGYNFTFTIGACIMLCAAVLVTQIKLQFKTTKKLEIKLKNIVAKEAVLAASVILFMGIGFSAINSFLIVFAGKQGVKESIGLFFTVYAVTMLVTRPMVGKLTDKYGLVKVAIPAILFTMFSFVLISFSKSLPMFLLAAFVNAFGYGACQPALQALTMKSVSKERRGAGSSTNFIGQDIGAFIGPMLAGACAQAFGYASMWRIMLIPLVIGMTLLFFYRKKIARVEEDVRVRSQKA